MITNDIKSGMELRLTHGRRGFMRDNKRGIIRTVEVEVPGQGTDVGSCYVDEIVYAKFNGNWEEIDILESHRKKLKKIRAFGF